MEVSTIVKRGLMISFEGVDGCGKSTQIAYVEEYLREQGYDVLRTREPGGCAISEKIREIILDIRNDGMNLHTEALLYAAARAQLVEQVILPALHQGKIVLCDRFVDSSAAYQGEARGMGMETVLSYNAYAVEHCMPDHTFYLDFTPQAARERMNGRGEKDRMEAESMAFVEKVYAGYEKLCAAYPERYHRIDVSGTKEETRDVIREEIREILKQWQG